MTAGEEGSHQLEHINIVGPVSIHSNVITLKGERWDSGLAVVIKWSLQETLLVQTSLLRTISGQTGL